MADTNVQYTQETILNDLRSIGVKLGHIPTRDEYRYHSDVPERAWRRVFGSYGDLLKALDKEESIGDEQESQVFTSDSWNINLPKTRLHTLDEVLEKYKVDLSVWSVERFKVGNYELGMKPPATTEYVQTRDGRTVPMWVRLDKEPVIIPLYRIEASFVKRKEMVAARQEIEDLKNEAKAFARIPTPVIHSDTQSGNLLEITLADLHIGKLSWEKESGSNYDTKIAEHIALHAIDTLLDRAAGYSFDRIVFVIGNDLVQADDLQGRTTKGTYVDTDGRYQKNFITARNLSITCIERLRLHAPVEVKVVPGNHDEQTAWCIGDSLECYFHNYTDVFVDNTPKPRKYMQWGQVMLLWTHGDKGKRQDLPLLMATEQPKMFGETKWREAHTGHIHQTQTQEWHGVRVRVLPSLSATDSWHNANMFTGQLRNGEAYIWNVSKGLIAQFYYNFDAEDVNAS